MDNGFQVCLFCSVISGVGKDTKKIKSAENIYVANLESVSDMDFRNVAF